MFLFAGEHCSPDADRSIYEIQSINDTDSRRNPGIIVEGFVVEVQCVSNISDELNKFKSLMRCTNGKITPLPGELNCTGKCHQ